MANTFDIRFDRAVGLASIFDAPANSFRWKGAGEISVGPEGIRVALKRSLVSLLVRKRSRRISAQDIKEVYREGEALRVEFATEENPRAVLPFWTRDRDTAAQIVQLLPTSRTVELELSMHAPPAGNSGRAVAVNAIVLLLAAAALFIGLRRTPESRTAAIAPAETRDTAAAAPVQASADSATSAAAPTDTAATAPGPAAPKGALISEDEARKLAMMAEDPVDWTSPPRASGGSTERQARLARQLDSLPAPATAPTTAPESDAEPEEFVPIEVPPINIDASGTVVPYRPGTVAYDAARSLLRRFEAGAMRIQADYYEQSAYLDAGQFKSAEEARKVADFANAWRELGQRLLNSNEARNPDLAGLRATLLGVVSYQAAAWDGAALAFRMKDPAALELSRQNLRKAEELMKSARQYLR